MCVALELICKFHTRYYLISEKRRESKTGAKMKIRILPGTLQTKKSFPVIETNVGCMRAIIGRLERGKNVVINY